MAISVQFMIIALNPQISLDASVHLTSKSWSSMFAGLQTTIITSTTLDWTMAGDRYHKMFQPQSNTHKLRPFHELKHMVHDGQVFNTEKHTITYFDCIEVINDPVESFQLYSTHILNNPLSAPEYRIKQSEQASYYERIIRNINVVLQMDQVHHVCEGLPQVPAPRYVPTREELENDDIKIILCTAQGDADMADKEAQRIHIREESPGSLTKNQNPDSETSMT